MSDSLFLAKEPLEKKPTRDGFGKALVELGEKDPNVWVLTADVSESTRTHWFSEKFPKRFVQVGVAEQNLAGVAAGIASCNKIAFISAYGVFSPGRNWDQIRVSICYNNLPVKIHASHTGLTVGPDGATHQALEDISIMRSLPNIVILAPSDFEQTKKATFAAHAHNGPVYIRSAREKSPVFTTKDTPFEIGGANVLLDGSDVAIFACGIPVYESLKAANELKKQGLEVAVIDCYSIKPINRSVIEKYAKKCGLIVSVEEHQIDGGLGTAISEVLSEIGTSCILKRHGVYNQFCESGEGYDLLKKYELDSTGIIKIVSSSMKLKK